MKRLLLALMLAASPAVAHDYNIADQTGASFLTDINNLLVEVATNNAGTTDPSTAISFSAGGLMWLDTNPATPVFRFRNVADTGWADLFTISGTTVTWQGNVDAASVDIDGGNIDGTVIGATSRSVANVTNLSVTGNAVVERDNPSVFWRDTSGSVATHSASRWVQTDIASTPVFALETLTDAGAFVSSDYVIYKNASGATEHSFLVGGGERLQVDSGGVDVTGSLSVSSAMTSANHTPLSASTYSLGSLVFPWLNVYGFNAYTQVSDARTKDEIGPVLSAECRAADRIEAKRYKRDGLIHFGYIAQEIEAAFVAEGLDPDDYALVQTGEDGYRSVVYAEVEALKTACH